MATSWKKKAHLFPWFLSGACGLSVGALIATSLAAGSSWPLLVWLGSFWLTAGVATALSFLVLEGLYYTLVVLPTRALQSHTPRALQTLQPQAARQAA